MANNKKIFNKSIALKIAIIAGAIAIISFSYDDILKPLLSKITYKPELTINYNDNQLFFDGSEKTKTFNRNRFIDFSLSAPSTNKEKIVISEMQLEIIDFQKLETISFPQGPQAMTVNYKKTIKINSHERFYDLLGDSVFYYKPNSEMDRFIFLPISDEFKIFKVKINIQYYSTLKPNKKYDLSSKVFLIANEKRLDSKSILDRAKKIDFYLDNQYAIAGFNNSYWIYDGNDSRIYIPPFENSPYNTKQVRFIFPENINGGMNNISVEDVIKNYRLSRSEYNVVTQNEFNKIQNVNASFIKNSNQFLIIDDTIVIQHIKSFKGQMFVDKSISSVYRKYFESEFSKKSNIELKTKSKKWNLLNKGNYAFCSLGFGLNNSISFDDKRSYTLPFINNGKPNPSLGNHFKSFFIIYKDSLKNDSFKIKAVNSKLTCIGEYNSQTEAYEEFLNVNGVDNLKEVDQQQLKENQIWFLKCPDGAVFKFLVINIDPQRIIELIWLKTKTGVNTVHISERG